MFLNHSVAINYCLEDGSRLELTNNLSLDEGYGGFSDVQRHDLLDGLKTKYYDQEGKEAAFFSRELERVHLTGNNITYEFTDEGIICGNKKVTLDGEELLFESRKEVENFDVVKEKNRIEKFIQDNGDMHKYTREALEKSLKHLDKKAAYTKEIASFYNDDIKNVRRAISIRNKVLSAVKNEIMNVTELADIGIALRNNINGKRKINKIQNWFFNHITWKRIFNLIMIMNIHIISTE